MEKTKPIGWLGAVLLAASIGLLFVPGAGVVAPVAAILALLFAPYTEFLGDFTEDKINDIEFRIKENEAIGKIIEKLESYAKEKGYDIDYDISRATTLLKKIKLFILSNACKKDEEEIKKYIDELNKAIENIPFFKMLSELHTKWADEQRKGKSGDDTPFCGPNREQIKRFLYGFKKEELLQFGLTDLFRQEVSIETTDAYKNAPYDVQKECKQLWDDLKAIYIEAMLNGVCDTEQKVLVASIALMVTNQVKRVLGEDLHKFAIVVERLEKLLHMNPGGFTLRDVEAGKSFLANYMVNNRCPECGYIGDGVFRDGANGHRLLCAACGADVSFEQYAAPELYAKIGRMFDEKCEGLEEAVKGQFNELKTLFVESVVAEIRAQNAQIKDIFATHNEKLDAISSQLDYDSREKEMWEKRWDEFINEWQNGQAKEEDALDAIRKSLEESRDESRQKLSELWEQIVEINATTKNILAVVCENEEFSKETLTKIDELIKAAVTKECLDERLRWQTKDIKALLESYEQRSGRRMGELSAVGVARIIDVVKKTIKDSQGNINESKINDQTKILKQQSEKVLDAVNKYGKENHALLVNIVEGIDKIQSDIYLLLVNGSVAAPSTRIPDEYLLNEGIPDKAFACLFCGAIQERPMSAEQRCRCQICGNMYVPVKLFDDDLMKKLKEANNGQLPNGVPTIGEVKKWRDDRTLYIDTNKRITSPRIDISIAIVSAQFRCLHNTTWKRELQFRIKTLIFWDCTIPDGFDPPKGLDTIIMSPIQARADMNINNPIFAKKTRIDGKFK